MQTNFTILVYFPVIQIFTPTTKTKRPRHNRAARALPVLQKVNGVVCCNILFAVPYNGGH